MTLTLSISTSDKDFDSLYSTSDNDFDSLYKAVDNQSRWPTEIGNKYLNKEYHPVPFYLDRQV